MNIARISLWVTAGVLAVLVGASSAAIADQVKYPRTSAAIGIGPMGQARANLAFASFAVRQKQDPKTAVSARERKLASIAYRSEPLSSAALGMIIASTDRGVTRQSLLDFGGRLTRRSSLITSASIEAAALRGDETGFFRWLSRAILTNESLRVTYIGAMAQATARPGADATLAPVIGAKPAWADRYWSVVVGVPQSLVNAAKLRVRVAGAPWRQTAVTDSDRVLALYLARDGHFDAVRQLALGLGLDSRDAARHANGFVNTDFSRQPLLPPIDWQLASSGNLGATIDPDSKQLVISAIAGARGYAARELVMLSPGAYEIEWDIADTAALEKGVLAARINCAEREGASNAAQSVNLGVGRQRANLVIANNGCRWYWLSIDLDVPDASAGVDVRLRHLNLRRIDRATATVSNGL